MKGDGCSRCRNCVEGNYPTFECHECGRNFGDQNQLNMHMQVHRRRDVACPVCGDVRFKSGANAVQHVESGFCRGCKGQDNARQQIYNYAVKQRGMAPYLSNQPQLTYGGWQPSDDVPDFPYHCPECAKSFAALSQLLQHQDQKHGRTRMIGY